MEKFKSKDAKKELENGYEKAEKLLEDDQKMERFLQRLEKKLKIIPVGGETLSMIPTMVSLLRSYVKKEYNDVPIGSVIAIVSALAYWLTPGDAIPDLIPGVGFVDDAAVTAVCLKLVGSDIKEYQKWRENNNKVLEA